MKRLRAVVLSLAMTFWTKAAGPASQPSDVIYANDFKTGTADFMIEQEQPAVVTARDGVLSIDAPAGVTVWLKQKLSGPVSIEYDATAVQQGGPNDRVSDLNCFWMADTAERRGDLLATPRSGQFADYDTLKCYYVGYGGNANTTTRFRRYIGQKSNRPLRPGDEYTDAAHLLKPNASVHLKLIADGHRVAFWRDAERLFAMDDAQPYRDGWFGFRGVKSHLEIRNLVVRRVATVATTQASP